MDKDKNLMSLHIKTQNGNRGKVGYEILNCVKFIKRKQFLFKNKNLA